MLKIFRFSLLITNTLLWITMEAYCMFILTRESCDNELFVPDIQRGQALINLPLSSSIVVDRCLEDSELSLQWLMKTKVNLSPLHVGIWWCSEPRLKHLTFRFSSYPYFTAMQDACDLKCQGNLDKNSVLRVVFVIVLFVWARTADLRKHGACFVIMEPW